MNDQNPPSNITGDNGCYHPMTNESDEPIIILVEEISAFIRHKTGKAFTMTRKRGEVVLEKRSLKLGEWYLLEARYTFTQDESARRATYTADARRDKLGMNEADWWHAETATFQIIGKPHPNDPARFNWMSPQGHTETYMRWVQVHSAREALIKAADDDKLFAYPTRWFMVKLGDQQIIPLPAKPGDDEIPF